MKFGCFFLKSLSALRTLSLFLWPNKTSDIASSTVGLLLLVCAANSAFSQENLTVYFYNPEINTTRNVVLKNTFDLYLKEQGAYQFQPVDSRDTFESLVLSESEAIFIMSSWHFRLLDQKAISQADLTRSTLGLRGLKNGGDTYHKILVGRDAEFDLSVNRLATSGTKTYTRSILNGIYPQQSKQISSDLNILVVPKDMDALMAVGFGLADIALTTRLSLDKLSTLYKNQYKKLHILGESQALKRLVVVFRQKPTSSYQHAVNMLINMAHDEKGKRGLRMLGLDSWKLIDETLLSGKSGVTKLSQDGGPIQ